MKVVIIKYNAGNIRSVMFALERIGVHAVVTDNGVLVVGAYYDIDVIKLLNVDFQFHFHSGTMTYMWTNSESKTPSVGSKK